MKSKEQWYKEFSILLDDGSVIVPFLDIGLVGQIQQDAFAAGARSTKEKGG